MWLLEAEARGWVENPSLPALDQGSPGWDTWEFHRRAKRTYGMWLSERKAIVEGVPEDRFYNRNKGRDAQSLVTTQVGAESSLNVFLLGHSVSILSKNTHNCGLKHQKIGRCAEEVARNSSLWMDNCLLFRWKGSDVVEIVIVTFWSTTTTAIPTKLCTYMKMGKKNQNKYICVILDLRDSNPEPVPKTIFFI